VGVVVMLLGDVVVVADYRGQRLRVTASSVLGEYYYIIPF
jgi:hypothetical protein